jgi:6-phosphogluconolactonase
MIRTRSTRRQFLAAGAALPFAVRSLAEPATAPRWVFLGTDTGKGIYRAAWNASSGELGEIELAVATGRPNFFARHPRLPVMYSVNELTGAAAGVSSFRMDARAGGLTLINRMSSLGDGPCFVSVDLRGGLAFVANYSGGSFTAYRLGRDGALQPPSGSLDCRHNPACGTQGPVHDRQEASHLHCATVSPDGYFVLACDLGNDSIEVFPIHPEKLSLNTPPMEKPQRFEARPGSGPRHVAFHPNGRWLYVIHELDCTVELFDWHVAGIGHASLKRRDGSAVSTLGPGGKSPVDTACEILAGSNGRFVYTCTRGAGSNTIEVFSVDAKTGGLTRQQQLSCGGSVPRHIAFDPTERWLLCANQNGPGVTVFAHDRVTGKLTGPVQTVVADTPMFVQFV